MHLGDQSPFKGQRENDCIFCLTSLSLQWISRGGIELEALKKKSLVQTFLLSPYNYLLNSKSQTGYILDQLSTIKLAPSGKANEPHSHVCAGTSIRYVKVQTERLHVQIKHIQSPQKPCCISACALACQERQAGYW